MALFKLAYNYGDYKLIEIVDTSRTACLDTFEEIMKAWVKRKKITQDSADAAIEEVRGGGASKFLHEIFPSVMIEYEPCFGPRYD